MKSNKKFITLRDNGVQYGPFPKKQLEFMKKALKINEDDKRDFCVGDFQELTPESFRQYIFKLRNYIEISIPTYPKFYKIKGINLRNNYRYISGKNIGEPILPILKNLGNQQLALNNLKMEFDSGEELYNVLINLGEKSEEATQEITLRDLCIDEENVIASITISSKTTQIKIDCKNRPIIYDMNGVLKITEFLGIIYGHLQSRSLGIVKIPSVGDWLCISYRLGINSQYCYNTPEVYVTWKDMAGGFIIMYTIQSKEDKFKGKIDARILL